MKHEIYENKPLSYFIDFNNRYNKGDFQGSEARPYDIDAIKLWISIRDKYTYCESICEGDWKTLEIVQSRSKYGTNYIFLEPKKKLWRINPSPTEFYGDLPPKIDTSTNTEYLGDIEIEYEIYAISAYGSDVVIKYTLDEAKKCAEEWSKETIGTDIVINKITREKLFMCRTEVK